MGQPRVSVVMPVRNGGRFLEPAVRSILDQELRDLELVVVDDGSTDDSPRVLQRLAAADPRVRVLTGPATGLVAALNQGCAAARAPLVARMDADDLSLPPRLARQCAAMDADPELVLLGTGVRYVDEHDRPLHTRILPQDDASLRRTLERSVPFTHSAVVMRRSAFERAGGYRAALRHAEDHDMWLRLAEHGRLGNLPEALVLYRIHSGQVMVSDPRGSALSSLLSVHSARVRRSGQPDPLDGVDLVTEDLLPVLGVPRSALEDQYLDVLLWYAPKTSGPRSRELWADAWRAAGASSSPARARLRVVRRRSAAVRSAEALGGRVSRRLAREVAARVR